MTYTAPSVLLSFLYRTTLQCSTFNTVQKAKVICEKSTYREYIRFIVLHWDQRNKISCEENYIRTIQTKPHCIWKLIQLSSTVEKMQGF